MNRSPLTPEGQSEAVQYYLSGHSLQETARAFSISKSHIHVLLKRAGILCRTVRQGNLLRLQSDPQLFAEGSRKGAANQSLADKVKGASMVPREAAVCGGIVGCHSRWHSEKANPKCVLCSGVTVDELRESFGFKVKTSE